MQLKKIQKIRFISS